MDINAHIMAFYAVKMLEIFHAKLKHAKIEIDIDHDIVMARCLGAWTLGVIDHQQRFLKDFRDLNEDLIYIPFYTDVPIIKDVENYPFLGCKHVYPLTKLNVEKLDENIAKRLLTALSMNGSHISLRSSDFMALHEQISSIDNEIKNLVIKWNASHDKQCSYDIKNLLFKREQLGKRQNIDVVFVPKKFDCLEKLYVWIDTHVVE